MPQFKFVKNLNIASSTMLTAEGYGSYPVCFLVCMYSKTFSFSLEHVYWSDIGHKNGCIWVTLERLQSQITLTSELRIAYFFLALCVSTAHSIVSGHVPHRHMLKLVLSNLFHKGNLFIKWTLSDCWYIE